MKFLLDTHAFIWWDSQASKIPAQTLALLKQPENELLVSVASLWEIQIKAHLGKLDLKAPLLEIVQRQEAENGIVLLPVALTHIVELDRLPWHHKNPFDRILIAQSRAEDAALVTRDSRFSQYICQTVW
jgi:PIN domain nuclease of toxin-antitoxin system